MKIAHIVPYSITFPLKVHNGRYDWVLQLVNLQVSAGHDVTVYCNIDSHIDGVKIASIEQSASGSKDTDNERLFMHALTGDHDIFHSHFDNLHFKLASETSRPIVYTQHYPPNNETVRLNRLYPSKNVWAVPPTQFMLNVDKELGLQSQGHIYHGVNLKDFSETASQKNNRLLFVGRITPYKRVELAIEVARRSGVGLDIVGKVAEKERVYWESLLDSIDGNHIVFHGAKTHEELAGYFSRSMALIFPSIPEDEAFGLVIIEAQACGTPVITTSGGARSELILDKKTGYLCDTSDDYIRAVEKVSSLSSKECRMFAERFDITTMAQKYNNLYASLV